MRDRKVRIHHLGAMTFALAMITLARGAVDLLGPKLAEDGSSLLTGEGSRSLVKIVASDLDKCRLWWFM